MEAILLLIWSLIWLAGAAIWIWALIDILRSEFSGSNKIIWLLVVFFIPVLGLVLYLAMGRKQKIPAPWS